MDEYLLLCIFYRKFIFIKRSLSTIATPKRTDYVLIATKNHYEIFKFGLLKKIKLQKCVFQDWLVILFCSISVFAQDSFGDLNNVFVSWLNGNLGKLLALLGFLIIFLSYVFTRITDGSKLHNVFLIGGTICIIAGGMVSIANTFFNMGITVF